MMTIKEWMELVDYRITEGSSYSWRCFGPNAYLLDSWNGGYEGYSFCMTFDTRTQAVYEVQVCDFANSRAYRMINPDYQAAFNAELNSRGFDDCAWDEVKWTDLEVQDDFVQKAQAIKAGESYDTRISVPLDFSDEELLRYMTMAHERDMKFNDFVEQALREAIENYQRDPEGTKAIADRWKATHDIA